MDNMDVVRDANGVCSYICKSCKRKYSEDDRIRAEKIKQVRVKSMYQDDTTTNFELCTLNMCNQFS